MADYSSRIRSILDQVIQLKSESKRLDYLDEVCGKDIGLRSKLDKILDALNESDKNDEPIPCENLDPFPVVEIVEKEGDQIGSYLLVQKIGEGGFGVVFSARQINPVVRNVALKLVKPGMDTQEVLARFKLERQTLAVMDHPGIARVFDAGSTKLGRPYFVMELVEGIPITDFCDNCRFTIQQRLELFKKICIAVAHAHQKGVIHRDLKPSNILVASRNGQLVPKIIDFGISKATDPLLRGDSVKTRGGQLIGTPLYMSPEQAGSGSGDVDIRSDIYSLGVVLYELLTGTTPVNSRQLSEKSPIDIVQIIREGETPKPSQRITASRRDSETIANNRNVHFSKLTKSLTGDLDCIVMKAISKDRDLRYESTNAFARDIQRHLDGDPIEARPASVSYRLRKFLVKYKVASFTTLAFALVLITATVISSWMAITALEKTQLALGSAAKEKLANQEAQRLKKVAEAATKMEREQRIIAENATEEAKTALKSEHQKRRELEEMTSFMKSTLRSPHPGIDGRSITVADILIRNIDELKKAFSDNPETKATMLLFTAEAFEGLALYEYSTPLLEEARDIHVKHIGEPNLQTAMIHFHLCSSYLGMKRIKEALPPGKKALNIATKLKASNRIITDCMTQLSQIYHLFGELNTAREFADEAIRLVDENDDWNSNAAIPVLRIKANLISSYGKFEEAIQVEEKILSLSTELNGEKSPRSVSSMFRLCSKLKNTGRINEARELSEKATLYANELYGKKFYLLDGHLNYLLENQFSRSHYETILPRLREGILSAEKRFGFNSPVVLIRKAILAQALGRNYRHKEAIEIARPVYTEMQRCFGQDAAETMYQGNQLAAYYISAAEYSKAREILLEVYPKALKRLGPNHVITNYCRNFLAYAHLTTSRTDLAIGMLEKMLKDVKKNFENDHPRVIGAEQSLGRAYIKALKPKQGVSLLEKVFQVKLTRLGRDNPETWETASMLAEGYSRNRNPFKALELSKKVVKNLDRLVGKNDPRTLSAIFELAKAYASLSQIPKAIEIIEPLIPRLEKQMSNYSDVRVNAIIAAASWYGWIGKPDHMLPKLLELRDQASKEKWPLDPVSWDIRAALANIYRVNGNPNKAVNIFGSIHKEQEKLLPKNHLKTIFTLCRVGNAYILAKRNKDAIKVFQQAWEQYVESNALNHPIAWDSRVKLADSLRYSGRYEEAIGHYKESRDNIVRILGTENMSVQLALIGLGVSYLKTEKFREAIPCFQECIRLQKRLGGTSTTRYRANLDRLAYAYIKVKKYKAALALVQEEASLHEKAYGWKNDLTLELYENVAGLYITTGSPEKSIPLLKRILKATVNDKGPKTNTASRIRSSIIKASLAAKQFSVTKETYIEQFRHNEGAADLLVMAQQYSNAGLIFSSHKQHDIALEFLEKSIALATKLPAESWGIHGTRCRLGKCLLTQGKEVMATDRDRAMKILDAAKEELLQGYEGLEDEKLNLHAGSRRELLVEASELLIDLYTFLENQPETQIWKKRLEKHKSKRSKKVQSAKQTS